MWSGWGMCQPHWETQRLKSVAGNISEQTLKRPKGMGYIALETCRELDWPRNV